MSVLNTRAGSLVPCAHRKKNNARINDVVLEVIYNLYTATHFTRDIAWKRDVSVDEIVPWTCRVHRPSGSCRQVDSGGVHDVVLAGGSAAIPRVRGLLREAFAFRGDQLLRCSINSAEVAAHGAALHAARLRAAPLSAEVVLREEGDGGGGEEEEEEEGEREEERRRRREEERRRRREEQESRRAVGFDLGTTYSAVAVCRKGRVEVLANDSGERTTPSVVAFLGGESFVGEAARDLPAACQVFDAKRLIGRSWKDLDVQADRKHWPFDVVMVDGVPKIKLTVDGKTEEFAPEEISALVLKALKETADDFLDETVTKAVITVPAYFNERQRQATKDAGRIAGLDVLAMINEPTAAAIAYGLDRGPRPGDDKKTVFIYDLGGGTFDVSIVTVEGSSIAVLASGGDTHLGGQDFDVRLLNHFTEDIHSKHGVELDVQAVQDLRRECEMAKRKLSAVAEATVSVFLARFNFGYKGTISRARFEDLCADLFKKTVDIATAVLADAELERGAVDEVVLVGGSTRIPKVRALLRELFAKEPRHSINPDEAVAHGAAVHAAVLSGDAACSRLVQLRDVTPLSLGVDIVGGLFLRVIPRNTAVPCRRTKEFYTVYDDQQTVDFEVFQGERELVKDNHSLNKEFSIAVPARPKGEVKMDMTFELDHDGLLTVTCVERSTGETRQVRL
ncbi:hypothetical protein ONE63_000086 [Megalurothrips usitatus]|uniref:Uncharacterized protein n=1 Tax=Megalurothrips usitatus TaxID=439358 RepID=A0AAV7Y3I4_9NEOP|nr:hypothetical protein ONE63_000086 [Megalurothrips usitatus]